MCKTKDDKLELEFCRIYYGANQVGVLLNLAIRFVDEDHNSPGLRSADLVPYPAGRPVLKPDQLY